MEEDKKLEYDDLEQSARFIETAERIQAEDAEERFEEAMKRMLAGKRKEINREKGQKAHS